MTVKVKNLKWEMIKPEGLPWSKIAWFSVSYKTPTFAPLESTRKTPASLWLSPPFFFLLLFVLLFPVSIFFGKSLLAFLFTSQRHGLLHPLAWPAILTCCLHQSGFLQQRRAPPPPNSLILGVASSSRWRDIILPMP